MKPYPINSWSQPVQTNKREHVLDRLKSFFTKYHGFANVKFHK